MQTHFFSIPVYCGTGKKKTVCFDNGYILLPDTYADTGPATRLVINCHGAGGSVNTDDKLVQQQLLTQYLLANGYAVMDMNGLPEEFAAREDIDICNNIGSPIAIDSLVRGYHYCMEHFNLYWEVFVHGGSMGGISSTNLVLSGRIPVLAQTGFCPVLDTYNQIFLHPWCGGLPKTALGKLYGLAQDSDGEYIYDEEKIAGFNPVQNPKIRNYPVPVKFWHCEDDPVVSFEVTKIFVAYIQANGADAHLRSFPQGGHEPQLAGGVIEHPSGNAVFDQTVLTITPAVEEAFLWMEKFN